MVKTTRVRTGLIITLIFLVVPSGVFSQSSRRQVPPFLVDEAYRLTRDCYFFHEYATLKQKGKWYVLGVFLSREAVQSASGNKSAASPQSPCGSKLPQVRLYRLVNDTTVAFRDSVLINSYSLMLGPAADFDGSGLHKLQIEKNCNVPPSGLTPLLCSTLSLFEVTEKARFRSLVRIGDVPERWSNDQRTGMPLDAVTSEHLDKSVYPELLAVDDFFEGDPAFRADDFPKVTLIYAWDAKGRVFKNASAAFSYRFQPMTEISRMPDDTKLVTIVEKVLGLAAVRRFDDARQLIHLNLTPERFSRWRAESPERGAAITLDRIRAKLELCIARYQ